MERHTQLWKQLTHAFREFIQKLAFWDNLNEKDKSAINAELEKVPQLSAQCFEAQYFELARRFEDFAVWANLHEHKKTKELIGSLSKFVKNHSALTLSAKTAIDIGF